MSTIFRREYSLYLCADEQAAAMNYLAGANPRRQGSCSAAPSGPRNWQHCRAQQELTSIGSCSPSRQDARFRTQHPRFEGNGTNLLVNIVRMEKHQGFNHTQYHGRAGPGDFLGEARDEGQD